MWQTKWPLRNFQSAGRLSSVIHTEGVFNLSRSASLELVSLLSLLWDHDPLQAEA